LRCQNCGASFTVELTAGQRIVDFAQRQPCPVCKKKPEELPEKSTGVWHHIIGFRSTKQTRGG